METKEKGIFAAGDIAVFPRMKTGKTTRIEHWAVAESQGQHAARAMLGNPESYREIPFFWTMQYDFHMKYIGYPGDADSIEYLGDVDKGSFIAGFFQEGKLKAAATLGMGEELFQIRKKMMSGNPVSPREFKEASGI
jgi:NADPH-dependent 2,4-dienoyl-CoA reductase/sulfur reductase-like enzyme